MDIHNKEDSNTPKLPCNCKSNIEILHRQLRKTELAIVKCLVKLIEAKDPYTAGHSERVTRLAMNFAVYLNLEKGRRMILEYACILHDIGKIGIPEHILNRTEKLTADEFDIIKKHPQIGYDAVKELDFLKGVGEIIIQHHERVDGMGYPNGLKADRINYLSKILCLCDSYDAMTSDRAYRKKLEIGTVMQELQKASGTQFDPYLTEQFISFLASPNRN
ncbi:MAG TPA: HD-GYP domain-containing protein [Ruminiclostridium sp.]|nr:HD-GYP domain-containing protein [Ruminiclostridium sp.]